MNVTVDAILFESEDNAALARFYQRAFELPEPKAHGDEHLGMPAANTYLGFDRVPDAAAARPSVWFRVNDVPAQVARMVELGATVLMAPDRECSPGETLAKLSDPAGNVVGLVGP